MADRRTPGRGIDRRLTVGLVAAVVVVLVTAALVVWQRSSDTGDPQPRADPSAVLSSATSVSVKRVEVLQRLPHRPTAFTQGLEIHNGRLFESAGLVGRSSLAELHLSTGRVIREQKLPKAGFIEGIAHTPAGLWQLTYTEKTATLRDPETFAPLRTANYDGEGWGLCFTGGTRGQLVMSNGTDTLTYRDPNTFEVTKTLKVTIDGTALPSLNELDCSTSVIYANVFPTARIAVIEPADGRVRTLIDTTGVLSAEESNGVDATNGIASIPGTDEFLITGKFWPVMLRVRFV